MSSNVDRNHRILIFLLLCTVYNLSWAFTTSFHRHELAKSSIMMSTQINQIQIQAAYNEDIPRVANFLGQYWYNVDISKSQRLEFIRLEKNDLIKRYGEQVGQRKYPAVMLMAVQDEEILGYANICTCAYGHMHECYDDFDFVLVTYIT
jgi:hypothetical protein